MIFAVRLRPFNRKKGHGMKTYKSAHLGKVYRVGQLGQPSPIFVVNDKMELRELRQYSQFEIIPFDDRGELEDFVERETLNASRLGLSVAPPKIEEVGKKKVRRATGDKPAVKTLFETEDTSGGDNSGRPPVEDDEDEGTELGDGTDLDGDGLDDLRKDVSEAEARLSEAKSKGRTQRTIEKWEERVAEAKEILAKAEMDFEAE